MADYKIGTTLAVDGEAQFKRAISDANKSIAQMGSALTLAAAEFKKDGDAMKLMESRSKTLRSEIDKQKAVVNALNGAVKESTEKYGENSVQVEEWQAKLNRAQAKLVSLELELENNSKGLDKNGKAFESAAGKADQYSNELDEVDNKQKHISFQDMNIALSNLSSGIDNVIKKAKDLGKAVWNSAVESSNRADEVATTAAQLGISPDVLREYRYAAQLIDTETDDIGKALSRLVNPSKEVKEALQALGVQTNRGIDWDKITPGKSTSEEARQIIQDGLQAKAAIDIFWDAIEKLSKAEDKERATQQIFGKSYQDMLPLILAGKEKWDAAVQDAKEKGIGLTDEIHDNLTTFNDSIVKLNEQFQAFKDTVGGSIAPGLTTVSDALGGFLEKLTLWAQSDKGQEALGKLSEAIAGVVDSFTEQDFTNLVNGAAGAIGTLTEALGWIVKNWVIVAAGVGAIKLAFWSMNATRSVLSALEAIKLIKWLDVQVGAKALSNTFGKAPSAGWLTLIGGLTTLFGPAIADALSNPDKYFPKVTEEQKQVLEGAAPLAGLKTGITNPTIIKNGLRLWMGQDVEWGEKELTPAEIEAILSGLQDRKNQQLAELYNTINQYSPTTSDGNYTWNQLQRYWNGEEMDLSAEKALLEAINSAYAAKIKALTDEAVEEATPEAEAAGESISQGVADGIDAGIPAAVEAVGRLAASVLEPLDGLIASVSARIASIGGGTFSGGGRTSGRGNSYTANSNLYVGTMNMNNGTDINGVASAIAERTRRTMASFGG